MHTVHRVDDAEIQGLVHSGYPKLTAGSYFLLKVTEAKAARQWLSALRLETVNRDRRHPDSILQVAFTAPGLRALGVPEQILRQFSDEFLSGMCGDQGRSRRLGDVGANAPDRWKWGSPQNEVDVLVMLFSLPGSFAAARTALRESLVGSGLMIQQELETSDLGGSEPFGFVDGKGQPKLNWKQSLVLPKLAQAYRNLTALGEFLLGYRNEYGQFTDRPLIPATDGGAQKLPPAADAPEMRDLGRNGTYLVFRQLEQDVRGFWQYLDRSAGQCGMERDDLAAKLVGRRRDGEPLIPTGPDPKAENSFTYNEDPHGVKCPFGAHIRRANPRTADLANNPPTFITRFFRMLGFSGASPADALASVRFHRLLRRGREYGPKLSPEEALKQERADYFQRGIHFLCLNANIERQFEFVQNAWVMSSKFGGLTCESDPLLGNRTPLPGCPVTDTFSMPKAKAIPDRLHDLPQFVTVRGGAYFFLPSLSALRFLLECEAVPAPESAGNRSTSGANEGI
jgi:deferrochelatase/peroxidase EfeB